MPARAGLVGKRFLCLAPGSGRDEPQRTRTRTRTRAGARTVRWRAGVIRAASHRDRRHPDLAVRTLDLNLNLGGSRGGEVWGTPRPPEVS